MTERPAPPNRIDAVWLLLFGLTKLALHLQTGAGYGYHRDEMYYLVCADHLAWGYVDHPPLSVILIALTRAILGDSPGALRVVPAVAGALSVMTIGYMCRQFGGGRLAQGLAMIAAITAPFYLALDQYFSMNAFDVLLWSVAASLLIALLQGGPDRLWIWLGLTIGVGLQNKISMLWLAGGIVVGLLLTPQRALLRTRGPWIAAALAAAIALPYAIWEVVHRFPTLEFMRESTGTKLVPHTVRSLVAAEIRGMQGISFPIYAGGLLYLFWLDRSRRFRCLGWTWVAVFALLAATPGSRAVYLAPAFGWLLAAGGVVIERGLRRSWTAGVVYAVSIVMSGAAAAPYVLPLVPREVLVASGAAKTSQPEERLAGKQPSESLAHMNGWPEIVGQVAAVYDAIPLPERASTAIVAPDYGIAAAIDVLGRRRGLPPAVSGHNSYWIWGLRGQRPDSFIIIGWTEPWLRRFFANVDRAGETQCEFCMAYDNHQPIWVARNLKVPFGEWFARNQHFN
jgi:hypothetical protein